MINLCNRVLFLFLTPIIALTSFIPAHGQGSKDVVQMIEAMNWITEQYPPFNFRDPKDGQIKGMTVDILMTVFEKLGIEKTRADLVILPWARGYKAALKKPGTALFSMTFSEERQKLFKFVGPVVPTQVSLIAKKSRALKVGSVEDMNQLKIGVIRDDIGDQLLRAMGVNSKAIRPKATADAIVRMLYRNRLDAIAYAEDIAKHHTRLAGLDPSACEPVYVLKKSHMVYAFHRSTNPKVLEVLQQTLDELRADGTIDRIREKYLK